MPSNYGSHSRSRPLGITALCLSGLVAVVFDLFGGIGLLGLPGFGPFLGVLSLAVTIGQVIVLVGLWNLRGWAQRWALILYAISVILDTVVFNFFGLLLNIIILAYLVSKANHFS